MNVTTLSGRLVSDPESKVIKSGGKDVSLCNFRIAVEDHHGDKPYVNYFHVSAAGRQAENAGKYLIKGQKVEVQGSLRQERWMDDGKNVSRVVIRADRVEFGAKPYRNGKSETTSAEQTPQAPAQAFGDDDLPF